MTSCFQYLFSGWRASGSRYQKAPAVDEFELVTYDTTYPVVQTILKLNNGRPSRRIPIDQLALTHDRVKFGSVLEVKYIHIPSFHPVYSTKAVELKLRGDLSIFAFMENESDIDRFLADIHHRCSELCIKNNST